MITVNDWSTMYKTPAGIKTVQVFFCDENVLERSTAFLASLHLEETALLSEAFCAFIVAGSFDAKDDAKRCAMSCAFKDHNARSKGG